MFGEELPSFDMKYFYECKHHRNLSRTIHYIATDWCFAYRQRICPVTANIVSLKYNRELKSWSVAKKLITINSDISETCFRQIPKEDFIYAYNRMLKGLANIEFE